MKIALAQTNPVVGDLKGNSKEIFKICKKAFKERAHLVIFPELALSGYPIEDLALRVDFIEACEQEIQELAQKLSQGFEKEMYVVVGLPTKADDLGAPYRADFKAVHNSAVVIHRGKVVHTYNKQVLPNYGVFDDYRIFSPGTRNLVFNVWGYRCAVLICEDGWKEPSPLARIRENLDLVISLNASPFWDGKMKSRYETLQRLNDDFWTPVIYVNQAGGQDELVFDGRSMVMDLDGDLKMVMKGFEADLQIYDTFAPNLGKVSVRDEDESDFYSALVLGVKDYCRKNGFKKIVLGVSGGIDSALCAAIAADAIGGENVIGVSMPSPFSSEGSITDAKELMENLGGEFISQPINKVFKELAGAMKLNGIAKENVQARIRGLIVMSYSNKMKALALATGNKSELAVGYSTAFGDSVGGFAPIKDVPKSLVYKLANYRNKISPVIPQNSIEKSPSAELKPNQKDEDALGSYAALDSLLEAYVENRSTLPDADFIKRVDRSEWKRRVYPIGPKISKLAFGKDRRIPITNHFN